MDTTTYISILREHSEYLENLIGQLTRSLHEVEANLTAQQGTPSAEVHVLGEGLPRLGHLIAYAAEVLSKRLVAFSEQTAAGEGCSFPPSRTPTRR
jgi:hypothetical protein